MLFLFKTNGIWKRGNSIHMYVLASEGKLMDSYLVYFVKHVFIELVTDHFEALQTEPSL